MKSYMTPFYRLQNAILLGKSDDPSLRIALYHYLSNDVYLVECARLYKERKRLEWKHVETRRTLPEPRKVLGFQL